MSVTKEIDDFIAANGANERDALNVALARLAAAEERIHQLRAMLFDEVEEQADPAGMIGVIGANTCSRPAVYTGAAWPTVDVKTDGKE